MSDCKEKKACHGDQWNEAREHDNDRENNYLQGTIVAVEEDESFASSPGLRVVHVFSAIMSEPRTEKGSYNFSWSQQVEAYRETGILND